MKFHGFHELQTLPIRAGDVVTIPKGCRVISSYYGERYSKRSYRVHVDHVTTGSNPMNGQPARNPMVVWDGSGDYENAVDINELTLDKTLAGA